MGSGTRFQISFLPGLCIGITVQRFPHDWSINVLLPFVSIYIGIGKGYDE